MKWSKRNRITILIMLGLLIAASLVIREIYKPHPEMQQLTPNISGSAQELESILESNMDQWQNSILELTGIVSEISSNHLMIDERFFCQLENESQLKELNEDDQIMVKGRLVGYDDLLMEYKIVQCVIVSAN